MVNIKRRMKRSQKIPMVWVSVSAVCENGILFIDIETDFWGMGTVIHDTDLPDGELNWLVEKIVNKAKQSGPKFLTDVVCIAGKVIKEETGLVSNWLPKESILED